MDFKSLNIYLIILTIIGLLSLCLYTFFFTPLEINLLNDNTEYLEKVVVVKGNIKNLDLKNNNLFLEVCNFSKCLDLVYFNISKNNYENLKQISYNQKKVSFTGMYTTYNNLPEMIIYKYEVK